MKARTICKRCHRLHPAGYCPSTQAEPKRRKSIPVEAAPPPEPEPPIETAATPVVPTVDLVALAAAREARKQARLARRPGAAPIPAGAELAPGVPTEPEPTTARSVPDPPVTAEEEVLAGEWAPSPVDQDDPT